MNPRILHSWQNDSQLGELGAVPDVQTDSNYVSSRRINLQTLELLKFLYEKIGEAIFVDFEVGEFRERALGEGSESRIIDNECADWQKITVEGGQFVETIQVEGL